MKILETSRLNLRQMRLDDAPFMLTLLNDPSWLRFIGDRGVRTVDDARQYLLSGAIADYARLGFGFYLVEQRSSADGEDSNRAAVAIGMCGLAKRDYLDHPDIGFAFLPEFCGQAYAFEAAQAVMQYARTQLGIQRLLATTRPDNHRSSALLQKLGMQLERKLTYADRELLLYAIELDTK